MKGGITQVPIIQQYLLLTYELLIQIWQILFVFYLEKLLLADIGFTHVWVNQGTFSKSKLLHSLSIKLEDRYSNHWKKLLFNDDNKNGGNKLRTYRKLKNSYKMEKFLHSDVDKFALFTFVKIRISNSNLNIERGRYIKLGKENMSSP
jgi:hypothetical protein